MFVFSNFLYALAQVLSIVLNLYLWIVIISVILSWIPLDPYHPIAQMVLKFLRRTTEPVFGFFRRTLKLHRYTAPLDVTPLIVILLIYFLQSFVVQTLIDIARTLHY
jgi:YggT family protein